MFEILDEYNKNIGNDVQLKDRPCVVTGQQVGLLGGPLYTILKAVSCITLARERGATPVFWAATEDHDVDEVNHTFCLDERGNLKRLKVSLPKRGMCVEDLLLIPQVIEEIKAHLHTLEVPKQYWPELVEGKPYARAMIQMLVRLFAGTGLVFVEPYLLRPFATSFFKKEIEEAASIQQALKTTSETLENPVLDFKHGTNLFLKDEEKHRLRLRAENGGFVAGEKRYSVQDLVSIAEEHSERFSTNVVSRPVLQSLLLPTLAYVAGPGEIAYYHHLVDYHRYHNVSMPKIVPRMSATFIPKKWQQILDQLQLKPKDPIPERWEKKIPEGVPKYSLHYLRNLLNPHNKPQERVLNFWELQRQTDENLIHQLLEQKNWT